MNRADTSSPRTNLPGRPKTLLALICPAMHGKRAAF
jgi:hypothetical protein